MPLGRQTDRRGIIMPVMFETTSCQGVSALNDWGCLWVQGADASTFLQQQLSHDFVLVPPNTARFAAYCNPQGRMMATFVAFPVPAGGWGLVLPQALLETVRKRLSMFVLRAKVTLTDAKAEGQLLGLLGDAARQHLPADAPVWSCHTEPATGTVAVNLPSAPGTARALLWCPATATPPPITSNQTHWDWAAIAAGMPWVDDVGSLSFVPQMLNLESLNGVSFKKGCYPGQEVVARSQFRGAIKRRTQRASAQTELKPGQDVFMAQEDREPVGVVVNAAPASTPDAPAVALVCLRTEALNGADLRVQAPDGPALTLHGLPYPLLEDI
jgi:folate-binding protein YgfZ